MILWILWATLLGGLFGAAAWIAERTLRAFRRPGRFVWLVAMGASISLPAWSLLRPLGPTASPGPPPGPGRAVSAALLQQLQAMLTASPSLLHRADPLVIGAWLAASVTMALVLVLGLERLRRRAGRWPSARTGHGDVLVSEDFGPAILGLRSPRVVLPRWALGLDAERLGMAYAHEDEHRAAGDGWLFLAGALAVVVAPWNVALWWQARRLRAAAEVDCDARVIGRGFSPAAYGALLLDVGSRSAELPLSVAALAKPRTLLERRLTMMVNGVKRMGPLSTAGALAGVVLLAALACQAPAPTGVQGGPAAVSEQASRTNAAQREAALKGELTGVQEGGPVVVSEQASGLDAARREAALKDTVLLSGVGESGTTTVVLKGMPSFSLGQGPASDRPLVLVDGKPADLSSIDSNDIASVSVLKGETAMKRYGARGAHGVVLIRMRKAGGGSTGK